MQHFVFQFSDCARGRAKEEKLEEPVHANNDIPSNSQRRQSNRYIDSSDVNDPPEKVQRLTNNYQNNHVQGDARNNDLDKKLIDSQISSIDDDALFDNTRETRNRGEKVEYNNEVADSSEQSRHFKQYYNTMQSEHKSMLGDKNYEIGNRDRRQAEAGDNINLSSSSTEKEMMSADISNEEDEAAIRRHIKKLSGEELEELLNSLSDDKKALLNKIIDNDRNSYDVNKREITKKAGAVEENSYIDGGLSEISKVQGGTSIDVNTESAVSQSSDVDNTKQEIQTESGDISTKTADSTRAETCESKADLLRESSDVTGNGKLEGGAYDTNEASSSVQSKTENKRETNLDYSKNPDGSFDDTQLSENYFNTKDGDDSFDSQDHFCSQEDDMSQLIDEEAQLHNNNERQYKREALDSQADLDDSIKSLEESFPNSNGEENGQYFESNMAPLVRVKRKDDNLIVKKRAAAVLPDAKVAFFPYKAENEDEDTDEGSEFDDEGFYDRTSNYAKNNANKPADKTAIKYGVRSPQSKLSNTNVEDDSKADDSTHDKVDTMSLGSDTDSVLSGVEGVDDNLMYNSGARNRRTAEDSDGQDRPLRSTPSPGDAVKHPDSFVNVPNYQESDAFGSLPRNYEGELSRYKRIRRVKPSSSPDVAESDDK